MTYRNNNNNNNNRRNNQQGGNFNNNNNYGGTISRGNNNVNPWDGPSMGGGNRGGSSNDALALANNLLNNLLRNQNQGNVPPSLLDMARYDGGYNNSPRGGGGYSNDGGFRMGRGGGGGRMSNNNNNNRRNNRIVKGAIRKPNAGNRKSMPQKNSNNSKQNDSANSTNKKNDDARNGDDKKEETVGAEPKRKNSPYSDVANDMFYCHLCAKHMWDSTSFENHLKGRTHQMMKEGVEESYRLRANMLRQEAKIAEQLKSIEIDRLKRLGKAIRAANQIREYCPMCDLQFYGHLSTHRKSEGHLDLKKFLHPKCDECTTEFHNRTEFDDHLLSPGHMKTSKTPPSYKSEESRKNRLQILTEADEIQGLREEKPKKEKKESPKEGETPAVEDDKKIDGEAEKMETDAVETADTSVAAVDGESKQDNDADEDADGQNDQPEIEPILDFNEGDEIGPEIETKIPKYNCKRQVGPSMISKLVCFECRLCNKYFDTEITSEIHTRTYNHHRLFVKFLNEKANETKIAQKRAAAAAEECERLKRIKLEPEMEVTKEEAAKSELYDPTEATGEDDPKDGANGNDDEAMDESASKAVEEEVKSEEQKVEEKPDEKMIVAEPIVESKPETVVQPAAETVQPATVVTPTPAVTTPAVTTPTPAVTTPTPAAVTPTPVVKTSTPAAVTQAPTAAVPTPTQNVQPVQAPVQNQNQVAPQQQTQSHGQNNNQPNNQNNQQNKQFNNNRGGRGGRNNNRRGRYGGRY